MKKGFKAEEFSLLHGITSWATCGTGKPREPPVATAEKVGINPNVDRYERLNLPRERREELGRKAKRLIDFARCKYIEQEIGLRVVKMAYYVELEYTLENVVLIAHK